MVFLIASDFFTDYELVKADSLEIVASYILSEGKEAQGIKILCDNDNTDLETARSKADQIIYISDYLGGF